MSRKGFKACLLLRSTFGGGGSNKRLWKPSLEVLELLEFDGVAEVAELAPELPPADLLALLALPAAGALLTGAGVGALSFFLGNGRPLLAAGAFLMGLAD